ncbi:hypothetical protein SNK05_006179 [Fusarium graminearum]
MNIPRNRQLTATSNASYDKTPGQRYAPGGAPIPTPPKYKQYKLSFMTKPTDELTSLTRPELARLLASRTGHGDFEKYHERFEHEDYNPLNLAQFDSSSFAQS